VCLTAAAVIIQQVALYGPSGPVHPGWFPAADKLQHALGFALPMFLVLMTSRVCAVRADPTLRPRWVAAVAGLFAVNAVVSELVQARPGSGRSGDPVDALADLAGILLGWLAFHAVGDRLLVRQRA
jgi:hypothetical protein